MNFAGANKFMDRMFRKADGVVWDLMTGKIGIKTPNGIATLGDDGRINNNLMDEFGIALPAFAQSTPVDQIQIGDIIYTGTRDQVRFVIGEVEPSAKPSRGKTGLTPPVIKKFRTMDLNGTESTWTPPKTTILGLDSGVMVLRSLMTMLPNGDKGLGQMQNMLMPLMMMGGGELGSDIEQMLPVLLMSQVNGGDSSGMGQMMQTMMMMKMLGGKNGNFFRG